MRTTALWAALIILSAPVLSWKPSTDINSMLVNGYWQTNKYAYTLETGDTLILAKVNRKDKDLRFFTDGTFKGWDMYGVCGNSSRIELLFFRNPKWKKQGSWKFDGNLLRLDLGPFYPVLMLRLIKADDNKVELVVIDKTPIAPR
jgi:hypothetical protein